MTLHHILPKYAKDFTPQGTPDIADICFVNIAYRPKPKGVAAGGPNGVLAVQQRLIGEIYRGFYLRYRFEPANLTLPELWTRWIKEQQLATMSRNLLAAHWYVQHDLAKTLPQAFSTRPGAVYHFVCHDIGSAAAAHMCGFPFTLIYHQQGSFIHERTSFGEALNETERYLMNTFEKLAFEQADRVYFPSDGAKEAFLDTTEAVIPERIRFGDRPLYNTIGDLKEDDAALREFLTTNGLEELLSPDRRKDVLLFVSVGDFTSNKGVDRCPQVLSRIANTTNKKVVWIAMGSRHKAGIYERLEEEKDGFPFKAILIPSRQDHALTMSVLKLADWLLMLQRHSIFDFSTLEAMKLGTGVILSPVGGNLEFNREGNVLYVDPNDITDHSIEEIVGTEPSEFGRLNQRVFADHFSPDCFVEAYRSIYDDVIERYLAPTHQPALAPSSYDRARDIFGGKTVLICGPGSSLGQLKPAEMEGKVLVGLNSALLLDLPFDVHVMQDEPKDPEYWDKYLKKNVVRLYGSINRLASQRDLSIDFTKLTDMGVEWETFQLSSTVFDERYDRLTFFLDRDPIADLRGVLFSAIQVAVGAGASSIELAGIDFSEKNLGSRNTNIYNRASFENLALMVRRLTEAGIPIRVVHSTSPYVKEIVASAGESGVPNIGVYSRSRRYGPIRRAVFLWGDKYLPAKVAKPIDRLLKRVKIF